jgi:hypothetical protein
MPILSPWSIRHNGKVYPPNTPITLDEESERRLVDAGEAEYVEPEAATGETAAGEELTVEAFAALKAAEQKAELEKRGLVPDSNEKNRIQQYAEWLAGAADGV